MGVVTLCKVVFYTSPIYRPDIVPECEFREIKDLVQEVMNS